MINSGNLNTQAGVCDIFSIHNRMCDKTYHIEGIVTCLLLRVKPKKSAILISFFLGLGREKKAILILWLKVYWAHSILIAPKINVVVDCASAERKYCDNTSTFKILLKIWKLAQHNIGQRAQLAIVQVQWSKCTEPEASVVIVQVLWITFKSKHLKGQLGPRVGNFTFLDQTSKDVSHCSLDSHRHRHRHRFC